MENKEKILKTKRVCFTGHRPEKLGISENEVKNLLRIAVRNAISDGFVTFISGMARGVDMWAAEIVIEEKRYNSDLRLVCASPYRGFESRWSKPQKSAYSNVISNADYVCYICENFSYSSFQKRNIWMVDRSARVIAVFNGMEGGTKNTIKMQKNKKMQFYYCKIAKNSV